MPNHGESPAIHGKTSTSCFLNQYESAITFDKLRYGPPLKNYQYPD